MRPRAPGRRLAALASLFTGWVVLVGWLMLAVSPPAHAAAADSFDRFDVVAGVSPEGYVEVTETIVLRFGDSSGRHGLERTLVTREADGDRDVIYRIDNVSVTSPSGVSTALDRTERGSGRNTYTRIRVGSQDRVIRADTATYVLSYRVQGLLRSSATYDELYWDLTGSSMPRIAAASAAITVPGGAQEVFCSVAAPGQQGPCTDSSIDTDGVARFSTAAIPSGQLLTVSVKLSPGLVSNNTPIWAENAEAAGERAALGMLGGSLGAAAIVPFVGWWYVRRRTADYRFAGVPPGLVPAAGTPVQEVRSDPRMEIPVSFAPPRLSLAEAGLLLDGETQVRDTTATLVGLAVAGAVQLRSGEEPHVRHIDRSRVPDEASRALFTSLFPKGSEPGAVVDLGDPGTLTDGHQGVAEVALRQARSGGWFRREPGASAGVGFGIGGLLFPMLVFVIVGTNFIGAVMILAIPLFISAAATWAVVRSKLKRGQRSGMGRAWTDQVEGFRTYLATAEADQLRFEEGEDIFSRYLPWAIMFDLTERWTRVCEQLVALGRIPDTAPVWYYGTTWDLHTLGWQLNTFDTHVGSSIAAPGPAFGDTGFGSGGSAFGGGGFSEDDGFSNGGGDGGGGGSW